jgi:acylphosphatase
VVLGLTGWVRNLTSGQVEAVFEGDENLVETMIIWCKEVPILARVTHVEVDKQPFLDSFSGFTIKSTFGW